jgi:hypothetical protein
MWTTCVANRSKKFVCKAKNPDSYYCECPLFLNFPFPRQSGTIVSGFAGTIEAISQLRFVSRRGWPSGDRFHER